MHLRGADRGSRQAPNYEGRPARVARSRVGGWFGKDHFARPRHYLDRTQFAVFPVREALRSIKLAIDQNSGAVSSGRVIGFTSSLPNEGKSTIAASVALLMAQAGARVILVDCDLRNPSLSRKLAPNADYGILDVIVGSVPLEDAVWRDRSTNLTFLPVSTKTRLMNSSEILAADATRES